MPDAELAAIVLFLERCCDAAEEARAEPVHAIAAVDSEACLVDVEIAWRLEDARALAPRNRSALLDMGSLIPPSTQGCAPLLRSAIAFSARRALAAGIRRSTCSAAEATYVQRCDDQPAADPSCCFDCTVDPAPAEQ